MVKSIIKNLNPTPKINGGIVLILIGLAFIIAFFLIKNNSGKDNLYNEFLEMKKARLEQIAEIESGMICSEEFFTIEKEYVDIFGINQSELSQSSFFICNYNNKTFYLDDLQKVKDGWENLTFE